MFHTYSNTEEINNNLDSDKNLPRIKTSYRDVLSTEDPGYTPENAKFEAIFREENGSGDGKDVFNEQHPAILGKSKMPLLPSFRHVDPNLEM
ncbi:hypothetical protein SUGI_1111780, partial [Cryptomeria japonica]